MNHFWLLAHLYYNQVTTLLCVIGEEEISPSRATEGHETRNPLDSRKSQTNRS